MRPHRSGPLVPTSERESLSPGPGCSRRRHAAALQLLRIGAGLCAAPQLRYLGHASLTAAIAASCVPRSARSAHDDSRDADKADDSKRGSDAEAATLLVYLVPS